MISRCPNCGSEVEDEAARCPSCEWNFDSPERSAPPGLKLPAAKPAPKAGDAAAKSELPPFSSIPNKPPFNPDKEIPQTEIRRLAPRFPPPAARPPSAKEGAGAPKGPRQRSMLPGLLAGAFVLGAGVLAVTQLRPGLRASSPKPPAESPPFPKREGRTLWVFEGQAYDLLSLAPVQGARLVFRDSTGRTAGQTVTGADGAYRVFLQAPTSGGYSLWVVHPGYRAFLDDAEPPCRTLAPRRRRRLAEEPRTNGPWVGNPSLAARRDLVLIPGLAPQ